MGGFDSPETALYAIRDCLVPTFCAGAAVHIGSFDSGTSLDCCQDKKCGLLRIEAEDVRPQNGEVAFSAPCQTMMMGVQIVWRTCFQSFGANPRLPSPSADRSEVGMAINAGWWNALRTLHVCSPANQSLRFVDGRMDPPQGACAGWTLRVAAELKFCRT